MDALQEVLDRTFEEVKTLNAARWKIKYLRERLNNTKFQSNLYTILMAEMQDVVNMIHDNNYLFQKNNKPLD